MRVRHTICAVCLSAAPFCTTILAVELYKHCFYFKHILSPKWFIISWKWQGVEEFSQAIPLEKEAIQHHENTLEHIKLLLENCA